MNEGKGIEKGSYGRISILIAINFWDKLIEK